MNFANVKDALETHAKTVGAAMANPIADVVIGPPIPGGNGRSVRIWFAGLADPVHFENQTLNSRVVAKRFTISAYFPVADLSTEKWEVNETEMDAYAAAILTALWGDFTLGGACAALEVEMPTIEYIEQPGSYGRVECDVLVEFDEYTVAA